MSADLPKLPKPLEKMIDTVLAYKPKKAKAKVSKKLAKSPAKKKFQARSSIPKKF